MPTLEGNTVQTLSEILARFNLSDLTAASIEVLDVPRRAELLAELQAEAVTFGDTTTDDDLRALHELVAAVEAVNASVPPSAALAPARTPVVRPASSRPAARPSSTITAAGGRPLAVADVAREMADALDQLGRGRVPARLAPAGKILVASVATSGTLPRLAGDSAANTATLTAAIAAHRNTLLASGGLCGPTASLHEYDEVVGTTARPVRNALVRLEADRGGVRFTPPPSLADVADGITYWTEANDVALNDPATKGVAVMSCPTEVEVVVAAVVKRLRFGNFRGRFFPAQVEAWMRVLGVAHAREAEGQLLATIDAGSTATTTGQVLGSARDVLAVLDRAGAQYRDRQRLDDDAFLTVLAPSWLRSMIKTDLTRQLPGDSSMGVTNAQIDAMFAAHGATVAWSLDANPMTAEQGVGPVDGWNSTVKLRLFAPGTWAFLDGGVLDLGVIRDSTLSATNDAEAFAETWEGAVQLGLDSITITADVCPNGTSSAGEELSGLCEVGS